MQQDQWIINARVIDPSARLDAVCDVLLRDGSITQIGHMPPDAEGSVTDAAGLVLAPGLVDMHVHLRDPGYTEKEDFFSGSRAAAAGGVTTLLAMPNTKPVIDNAAQLADSLRRSREQPVQILHCAAVSKDLGSGEAVDFAALAQAGAAAFSDDGKPVYNAALTRQAMEWAKKLGLPYLAHCEDASLAGGGLVNETVAKKLGVKALPAAAEDVGTARELALSMATGLPVHICHVSTRVSLELIRAAKRFGAPVTAETAPHYFSLTEDRLLGRDANFRMNPPLRTQEDVEAVISALQDGTLDAIATDHAPHTPLEKADFLTAPNGVIGMETSLSAGMTWLVEPGHLTLTRLLELMSVNPARILGMKARTLAPGSPADILLFDPQAQWKPDPAKLHGKSRNTPYAHCLFTGRVEQTYCSGVALL